MKMTVISAGLGAPHAGWAAVDELAHLLSGYFEAELLTPAGLGAPWWRRVAGREQARFAPQASAGGDVLFVVARGPQDLAVIDSIPQVRRRFGRIHAFVTDSYFQAGYPRQTRLYDGITVTACEDMAFPRQRFGTAVHHVHQGVDALRWAPRGERHRDIDVLAYGRTPPSYHACLQQRFHDAASPHLYLHSPLGNLTGPTVQLERGMLFKLLHRTRLSLAFHLMVEPQGNRPRSMMVTSRWLESLVAGCIVVGRRPHSRMADDMLCWAGATLELPPAPADAADEIEALLDDEAALAAQRGRNIAETTARHDWRWRIQELSTLFGWEVPPALRQDLQHVEALARHWAPRPPLAAVPPQGAEVRLPAETRLSA